MKFSNILTKYLEILFTAQGDMAYASAPKTLAALAKGAANLKMFMNAGATAPEWAAGIKFGSFTREMDAATGDVNITGVGFKPSLIMVMNASPLGTSYSIGWGTGLGANQGYIRGTTATFMPEINTQYIGYIMEDAAVTKYQSYALAAFIVDGFTLSWIRVGATAAGTATLIYVAFR